MWVVSRRMEVHSAARRTWVLGRRFYLCDRRVWKRQGAGVHGGRSSGEAVGAAGEAWRRGGEFDLPHAIQVVDRVIYVADRENGRLQAFDLRGRFLGEIDGLGRVYAFDVVGDVIWVSMGPLDREPGSEGGWVVTVDRRTGKILGHLAVRGARGGHALALMPSGEPLITLGDALLWFQAN